MKRKKRSYIGLNSSLSLNLSLSLITTGTGVKSERCYKRAGYYCEEEKRGTEEDGTRI